MNRVLSQTRLFEDWIEINLDNLSEYTVTVEDLLDSKLKNFTSWVEKEASKVTGEQQEDFYEFYADDYHQFSRIFPNILRSSLFIMLYSFLENQLVNLCGKFHRQYGYTIKLTDLRGEGIVRAKNYLKKVVKIDFPDQTPSWDDIIMYNRMRNFIVHNGGQLDNNDQAKQVESFISARPSITLDHLRNIQFSKDFCGEVINTLRSFFGDLLKPLP